MRPFLSLKDLQFEWQGRTGFALSVPELSVAEGEKLFLLGESGSGKSTLLSLICGIITADAGHVQIDGTDLGALRPAARDAFRADHIGVIFQMFNLLPYASPLENILLPLSFAKLRRQRVENPKEEALRLTSALGLAPELVEQADTRELSIGQQQRVAAARALLGRPRLIVADEPTSALDATAQAAFLDVLMTQTQAAGATLIMVSHDERLAQAFDRCLDLSEIAEVTRTSPRAMGGPL
ncbi:ABC transporter ATP-binding protein [Shimia marina]|uniref:Putative ABC transporter ATP-binding protein/MT1014 n=1 Tax=Shimia marina TaxID=321267 RepID=A0A0P1EJM5_9RHOB|nr:ABC transporter ATP-binding protein [Shimia marina]CUH50712.1 putative ABC transporter ATP-binding protein/MT1014 [Shimia marina]SFE36152.1 putative ABC transport system ATP-binding protein [Shimia marina]